MTERKKHSALNWETVVLVVLILLVILSGPFGTAMALIWLFVYYALLLRPAQFAVGVVVVSAVILTASRFIRR
jgi:hypothetical protein